jgi:hypothetical protein
MKIAELGALQPLVQLLMSTELPVLEHSAGALRNLSVHPDNKAQIVAAGAVGPLINLLMSHSPRIQLQVSLQPPLLVSVCSFVLVKQVN